MSRDPRSIPRYMTEIGAAMLFFAGHVGSVAASLPFLPVTQQSLRSDHVQAMDEFRRFEQRQKALLDRPGDVKVVLLHMNPAAGV
jgi:hypothetical protein